MFLLFVVENFLSILIKEVCVKIRVLKLQCDWRKRRTKKEKERKTLSLKCKVCIRFEGVMNSMSIFK